MLPFAILLYAFLWYPLSVLSGPIQSQTSHQIGPRADTPSSATTENTFKNTALGSFFYNKNYRPDVERVTVADFKFLKWNSTTESTVLMKTNYGNGLLVTITLNAGAIMLYLPEEDVSAIQSEGCQPFDEDEYKKRFEEIYIKTKDGGPGKYIQAIADAKEALKDAVNVKDGTDAPLKVWDFRIQMTESRETDEETLTDEDEDMFTDEDEDMLTDEDEETLTDEEREMISEKVREKLKHEEGERLAAPDLMVELKMALMAPLLVTREDGKRLTAQELKDWNAWEVEEVPVPWMEKDTATVSAIFFERYVQGISSQRNRAVYRVLLGPQYKIENGEAKSDIDTVKPGDLVLQSNNWFLILYEEEGSIMC